LIMNIITHNIESIILSKCSSMDGKKQKQLDLRMKQLREIFFRRAKFHEKWTWPKREGMSHVTTSTVAPPGNSMPYMPLKTFNKSPCTSIWNTFVQTLGKLDAHPSAENDRSKRLSAFLSLEDTASSTQQDGTGDLPHILHRPSGWLSAEDSSPKNSAIWKDLLLSQGGELRSFWNALYYEL